MILTLRPFRFVSTDVIYIVTVDSLSLLLDFQVRSWLGRMINRSFHLISFQANRIDGIVNPKEEGARAGMATMRRGDAL